MIERIVFVPSDKVSFVYDDDLVDLFPLGDTSITRKSMVEPGEDCKWYVSINIEGTIDKLGPFKYRESALEAERATLIHLMHLGMS